jgi:hypothetical protein
MHVTARPTDYVDVGAHTHTHTHTHTHLKQLENEKRRLQTIGDIEDTGDVEEKVRLITQLIKMLRKTIESLQGDTTVNLEEIANLTQCLLRTLSKDCDLSVTI